MARTGIRASRLSALFVIMGMALAGCARQAPQGPPPFIPVEMVTVKPEPIAESSEYLGTLISRQSVDIQSKAMGIIQSIPVQAGDRVGKGQVLVQIRADEQRAGVQSAAADAAATQMAVAQSQKALDALRAERQALQSSLSFNETQYQRYSSLLAQQSASKEEVDRLADAVQRNRADLASNQARMQSQLSAISASRKSYQAAQAVTRQRQALVGDYVIRAPFGGIVGDVPKKVGNYVQPLDKILSLTRNSTLELNVELPSEDAMRIRMGMPLQVLGPDNAVIARTSVSFIAPRVSPDTQTILVKGIFPNKDGILKADQTVRTRIVWNQHPGILIPTSAALHLGGRDFVYVAEPNAKMGGKLAAKQVPVVLGPIEGGRYVVRQGLAANATLITGGIQKLQDGVPVKDIATLMPPSGAKPGMPPGAAPAGGH